MPLYVVATDGHALSQPRKMTEFFIGPGERIDAIAVGPPPGEYPVRTISFQNEAWRPPEPVCRPAVIISSGLVAERGARRRNPASASSRDRNGSTTFMLHRSRGAAR